MPREKRSLLTLRVNLEGEPGEETLPVLGDSLAAFLEGPIVKSLCNSVKPVITFLYFMTKDTFDSLERNQKTITNQ